MPICYSKKIHVLHVVSNISIRSGIMSYLISYNRRLQNTVFHYLFFDERENTYYTEICRMGGNVIKVPNPRDFFDFSKAMNIEAENNFNKYDIVELHDPFMITFFSSMQKKWGIKKIVVHAHSTRFSDSFLGEIRNRILSFGNIFIPNEYFACSPEAGLAIFGNKFKKTGTVINNAIDCKRFYPSDKERDTVRTELGVSNDFVVGHVGNFSEPKNHKFLIDIFNEVFKKNHSATLVLIGDGPRRRAIEDYVTSLGLQERVRFLGVKSDVNKYLRSFDCFLFPSIYEGLGIALIEAQATGIPCVFSDTVPNIANIFSDRNRRMSLTENPTHWADAVLSCEKSILEDAVERITAAGFNIDVEVSKLEHFYGEMI